MKIPKKQLRWVILKYKGNEYLITSALDRSIYFLYKKIGDNDYEQISKGNSPTKLEQKLYRKEK